MGQREEKTEIRKEEKFQEEKYLHERAKRQKTELQLGQMKGELHSADAVRTVMTDMLSNFKAQLLAMPTKAAPTLIGRSEISVIEDLLKDEVQAILMELKDYNPSDFIDSTYIDMEDEEAEEPSGVSE